MAADLLVLLLRLNLAAGLAILCVMILRVPARRLFGPDAAYALWLAAPLASAAALAPARTKSALAPPGLPLDTVARIATEWAAAPTLAAPAPASVDMPAVLLVLWLAGCTLGIAAVVILHRRSLARLGRLLPTGDAMLLRSERVWSGPAVVGALRPRIVLPADFEQRFTAVEQKMILAHERVHLARADAAINAIVVTFQCLNWMNPFVHLGAWLRRLDQEMACDAAVVATHPDHRRAYAQAMLKTQLAPLQSPLGCSWPARGANPLKERFAMLKMKSPNRPRRYLGAATISLIVVGTGYAAWASNGEVTERAMDVVEGAARPVEVRLAEVAPALRERVADAAPVRRPATESRSAVIERPLTETEIIALDGARAGLAAAYERQRLALISASELAAQAAKVAELERVLGQKPTVADEALRLADADLRETQEQFKMGAASRSDIGYATERFARLQLALGRRPTAANEALRLAEADIKRAQEEFKVGLNTQADIGLAADRLVKLQLALGQRPTAQPISAQTAPPAEYTVTVSITDDGQLVGKPTLTLAAGHVAEIQSDRFRIHATLTATSSNTLKLQTTISRPEAEGWVVVARPTVTLVEGAQASMQITGAGSLIELGVKPKAGRAPS